MKKLSLMVALVLAAQFSSTNLFASYPPGGAIAAVVAVLAPDVLGFGSAPKSQTVAQSEFSALNSNPAYESLLNQTAGGELNTVEILK
jgi:hypothetical protein